MKMKLILPPADYAVLQTRILEAEILAGGDVDPRMALPCIGVFPPRNCTGIRIVVDPGEPYARLAPEDAASEPHEVG